MRVWMLLFLCTFSHKPSYDIHPRYLYMVADFVKRCGNLCIHPERAQLTMQPVSQLEMYEKSNMPGIIGVSITTSIVSLPLKYEVYVLSKLHGTLERAVVVHELFHSLAGMPHVEQNEFSFMAPDSVDPQWYADNWEALWKADLCRLARDRGYFDHEACEGL